MAIESSTFRFKWKKGPNGEQYEGMACIGMATDHKKLSKEICLAVDEEAAEKAAAAEAAAAGLLEDPPRVADASAMVEDEEMDLWDKHPSKEGVAVLSYEVWTAVSDSSSPLSSRARYDQLIEEGALTVRDPSTIQVKIQDTYITGLESVADIRVGGEARSLLYDDFDDAGVVVFDMYSQRVDGYAGVNSVVFVVSAVHEEAAKAFIAGLVAGGGGSGRRKYEQAGGRVLVFSSSVQKAMDKGGVDKVEPRDGGAAVQARLGETDARLERVSETAERLAALCKEAKEGAVARDKQHAAEVQAVQKQLEELTEKTGKLAEAEVASKSAQKEAGDQVSMLAGTLNKFIEFSEQVQRSRIMGGPQVKVLEHMKEKWCRAESLLVAGGVDEGGVAAARAAAVRVVPALAGWMRLRGGGGARADESDGRGTAAGHGEERRAPHKCPPAPHRADFERAPDAQMSDDDEPPRAGYGCREETAGRAGGGHGWRRDGRAHADMRRPPGLQRGRPGK